MEKELTFEKALARLEEIVKALEAANTPLDESLSLFEEGSKLVKFCNEKISTAEKKVKLITEAEGMAIEQDFTAE